ncbi:unnamed protein product [[Candida] boidinii]|nr:unnamed protein product [[Candida] boidinii]
MANIGKPNEDNLVPAEEGSDGEEIELTTNHDELEPSAPQPLSNIDNNVSTGNRSNNNESRDNKSIQEGSSKDNNTPSESDGKDQNANIKASADKDDVPSPSVQSRSNADKTVDGEGTSNNNDTRGKIAKGSSKHNNSPSESDGKDQNANIKASADKDDVPPPSVQSRSNADKTVDGEGTSNNNDTRGKIAKGGSKHKNSPSESDGKDQNANIETPATNREVPSPPVQPHLDAEETENRELPPPDNRNIFIRAREAEQNYHLAFFFILSFIALFGTVVGTTSAAYTFKEWNETTTRDRTFGIFTFIGVVFTILAFSWYCTFFWRERLARERENREREPDA